MLCIPVCSRSLALGRQVKGQDGAQRMWAIIKMMRRFTLERHFVELKPLAFTRFAGLNGLANIVAIVRGGPIMWDMLPLPMGRRSPHLLLWKRMLCEVTTVRSRSLERHVVAPIVVTGRGSRATLNPVRLVVLAKGCSPVERYAHSLPTPAALWRSRTVGVLQSTIRLSMCGISFETSTRWPPLWSRGPEFFLDWVANEVGMVSGVCVERHGGVGTVSNFGQNFFAQLDVE